jgi:phytoene synthase
LSRDTNFYYSFLVLPPVKRRAIVAVWDFCRAVDDAADEAQGRDDAAEKLRMWRAEVDACFRGTPDTPQGHALAAVIPQFQMTRAPFDALIEGVEMDLVPRRYETFEELYQYCIRVASAVGLMCLDIFGYQQPASRQYATDLGVALQLTNILRDVPDDLARGRIYIPQEDFRTHGCTEDDLRGEAAQPGGGVRCASVKALLKQQAERARSYYARAATVLPSADARRLVAAQIMGAIYERILRRIERREYDVFSEVVRIPRPQRAVIAAGVWARTALFPR